MEKNLGLTGPSGRKSADFRPSSAANKNLKFQNYAKFRDIKQNLGTFFFKIQFRSEITLKSFRVFFWLFLGPKDHFKNEKNSKFCASLNIFQNWQFWKKNERGPPLTLKREKKVRIQSTYRHKSNNYFLSSWIDVV